MSLPIFKSAEEVPDAFRSIYEEQNGEWHAKVEPVPDVTKLQSALDAERTQKGEVDKERKRLEKELTDLKRKETAAQHGISDEQLEKLREEDASKRRPIEDELATLRSENRKLKLTDRVQALALKAGVMQDRIEDAMLNLDKRVDLTDGENIVVKDKAGNVTTEKVEDFLAKTFKTEKPWLYGYEGGSGSGTPPGTDLDQPSREAPRNIVNSKRREPAYGGL